MTKKERIKEFWLSNLALRNSTSVFVMLFIIMIAGWMSYTAIPKESFPEVKQPTIFVGVSYPGNSPIDMENLVTRPLEKEIKKLSGISKMSSTSIQDYSTIVVEFEYDVDPRDGLYDVKDAVDKARKDLPNDLPADPNIFELDFSEFPVMNVNLYGDFSFEELKHYAEYLQDEIENLSEISGVDIRGLPEKEVKVIVDLNKMAALRVSFNDIENAISSENVTLSGGNILSIDGDVASRRTIRITGEFSDFRKMEGIIVKHEHQKIVTLGDIAQVEFGNMEPTSFARLDGKNVVSLDIKKKSKENLINASGSIKKIIAEARRKVLPKDLHVIITNDQSKFTVNLVKNLENSIISGILLVVLVLLFFMGIRNASIVGTAIPLSMFLGITILYYTGNTLSMIVLFSLILALGMLVDNGIVVVENIYRLYSEGYSKAKASRAGAGEVAMPIISSTVTTVLAFVPLLFWKSMIGEFFKFLPLTLIIVLASSLFVGLVVNPVLTSKFIKIEDYRFSKGSARFWIWTVITLLLGVFLSASKYAPLPGGLLIALFAFRVLYRFLLKPAARFFQERFMIWLVKVYTRSLKFALSGIRPLLFFVGVIALLIFSLMFFAQKTPKVTFFPDNNPNYVNVFIEMPDGTDIEYTNKVTKEIEKRVNEVIRPYQPIVEAVVAQVGEGTGDPARGFQQGSSPNKARVTVSFLEYRERIKLMDVSTSVVMQKISEAVRDIPEVKNISVEKNAMGPPVGKPISIEVSGEDYAELLRLSDEMIRFLESANVPGVEQLKTDVEVNKPELIVDIDREAARRYGLSTAGIAMAIRTALFGKEVDKYKIGEDDYPINVRLKDEQRYQLGTLLNMPITFRDPASGRIKQVPISSVVTIHNSSTLGTVKRKDQNRVITIYSNVIEGYNANDIVAQYKALLSEYDMPKGYEYKFTGEQEEQAKSLAFLEEAMMIAVFLIFLVIVSQFNSFVSPLIIMFSVILSTIGVFLGFAIFQIDISILMVGIGIISLAGIVVNNAIVLIDFIKLSRERRREELGLADGELLPFHEIKDSIIKAGQIRLRPVLLTAITTVLGLIPLAIGFNIDFYGLLTALKPDIYFGGDSALFWGPMSWTVIFGLSFATFLTLIIVPVMYLLVDMATIRMKRLGDKVL